MASGTDNGITREVVEGFYAAFEAKSVPQLKKFVTQDWEYIPEPAGAAPGPEQMTRVFENMATALPDMKIAILDLLIHDDRAAVRAEISGTQSGALLGIEASSRHVRFAIHSFHKMRGDLIEKTWHLEDWLSVFRQLGQFPQTLDQP
jgi:predicted ester cyclase